MNATGRRTFLRTLGLSAAAARFGAIGSALPAVACAGEVLSSKGSMPSLSGATEWLNSAPLTETSVRGKVVLVQFWTYTCINWLRTLPYIRAWANSYQSHEFIVLGIHSPEFAFEKTPNNVRRAVRDLRITYPVAVDSNHHIWRNFDNSYWPALYLVDAKGRVRYRHFGEGKYDESERAIQLLLTENGHTGIQRVPATADAHGLEAAADWSSLRSPETYLGRDRTERFASPSGYEAGRHRYAIPDRLSNNEWALAGQWTMLGESCRLHEARGKISVRFHARDVHLVMGPATGTQSVRYRVTVDGHAPRSGHGSDVDADGNGVVREQRLYQLVRQTERVTDRLFEIEFLDPDVECFAFTFG